MPSPVPQKITAWSYSRWQDYLRCPALAKYKHVEKRKEPGSQAMQRGTDIHAMANDAVRQAVKAKVAPELKAFEAEFKELRRVNAKEPARVLTEKDWAFDSKWQPTGWFDSNAWCRVKIDLAVINGTTLHLVDHKTGKIKPEEHGPQLSLYGLAGLLSFETVREVRAENWYIDHGVIEPPDSSPSVYRREDLPKLKKVWLANVKPMLSDTRFEPKPSHACTWCHFSKAKGGPCKY